MKRKLVLENHRVFYGEGFGSPEKKIAEIVPTYKAAGDGEAK